MERRTKRCINWTDSSHLEEMESWFTDMSSKGWELQSIGKFFCIFEKKESGNNMYRMDIFDGYGLSGEDRISLYQDAGWEHVCSKGLLQVFRAPQNAGIPEIHTDPAGLAINIEAMKKRAAWFYVIFLAVVTGALLLAFLKGGKDIFLESSDLITACAYIFICVFVFTTMRSLIKQIKSLKQGQPFNHISVYKKRMWRTRILIYCSVLFSVVMVFRPLDWIYKFRPIPNGSLPVVSMYDLLPHREPLYAMLDSAGNNGDEQSDNKYEERWSILVPKQTMLQEKLMVPGIVWGDDNRGPYVRTGEYDPSIMSQEYRAITPVVAKMLFQALLDETRNYPFFFEHYSASHIPSKVLDNLWCFKRNEYDGDYILIACKGERVYYIDLLTMEPLDRIISALEEKARE